MKFVIIPARLKSSRLTNKLLIDVDGLPLIWYAIDAATKSAADAVIVGTDHNSILNKVKTLFPDVPVYMTEKAKTGTARVAGLVHRLDINDNDSVINLQADESLMTPAVIDKLFDHLEQHDTIVTYAVKFVNPLEFADRDNVKVVRDVAGDALYFSRATIPHNDWYEARKHVGIYGSQASWFKKVSTIAPCPYASENLEQLDWLYAGQKVHVLTGSERLIGIDTLDDLQLFKSMIEPRPGS